MNNLPANNFEEQLARFQASKKITLPSLKPCTNKKFTFKKSLSLGKSSEVISHNPGTSSNSAEIKTVETNKKPALSNKSSSLEKFTFKSYGQQNIPSGSNKQKFTPDIQKRFSPDLQKKTSPDIRNFFSCNEVTDIQVTSEVITTACDDHNVRSPETLNPVSGISTKTSKSIFPVIDKYNKNVKQSEFNCIKPVHTDEVHVPGVLQNTARSNSVKDSPASLKEINFKIMTKICDILENEKDILIENKDLNHLITLRKRILQQTSISDDEAYVSKNTLNTSIFSDKSENILDNEDDDDFLTNKCFKKLNSLSLSNTSVSSGKLCSNLDSSTPIRDTFHFKNEPSHSNTNEVCKLKTPSFVSAKSLTSAAELSFRGNSVLKNASIKPSTSFDGTEPSLKRNSSLKNELIRAGSSFDNQSFKCDPVDDVNIEMFDENGIETIEDFSEFEDEPDIIYEKWDSANSKNENKGISCEMQKSFNVKNEDKEKVIAGKFYGNQRDDGASSQYKGFKFPFSADVMQTFQNVFGLKKFRHNQLEAINASLLGEDCFILMPTGGGKSLCYQLPSLVSSGVTIVVSPLRSLIMDQVQKLCSLDIPASSLTGDADASSVNYVYSQLASREPSIKLLYVTPEKISASDKLVSSFESLYSRNMIQRFIIDEAHCVSQWGHDFRPDYKRLKVLRDKFPKVPFIALTATATTRVRSDILLQLGMKSPKWFLQSFNRPNLKYEVREKTRAIMADIMDLLQTKFKNMCGIIYCLSRNDCDTVANTLQKNGIRAISYHAGINNRDEIQEQWINDKFKVICATIAFGMGIDKPDVRFVIHHAMPKSIEGYYQESGRAGRDGELSWCILYYTYSDLQRIKRMITRDQNNKHSWSTHFDNLFKMFHYCENKTDCRRVWMLGYFGEIFDKSLCLNRPETSCDNCFSKEVLEERDLTEDAKSIVKCVSELVNKQKRKNYTLTYFVDIYKGAKTQKVLAAGHDKLDLYGKGHSMHRSDAERLLRKLILDQHLQEDTVVNKMNLPIIYVYLGKRANDLLRGKAKVILAFQRGKSKIPQTSLPSEDDKEIQELIERCYNELIEVSKSIASERNMHYTNVINVEALRQMSREMPMTEEDMLSISHVTHAVYEKYGKKFLEVTQRYAAERCVIDAERADQAMLTACVEDIDAWSDTDAAGTSKGKAKKAVKRKAKKQTGGKAAKKQKNFYVQKVQKAKSWCNNSGFTSKKKMLSSQKKAAVRTPGFMPNPKTLKKVGSRSFLPTPRVVTL